MEPKQCCLKCRFHFFDEDKCPNCEAEQLVKEYQEEWDRQLVLLEKNTGIGCNDDFWALWDSNIIERQNWFRTLCQDLAPDIYDWYLSLDLERSRERFMLEKTKQLNLFDSPLPF